MSTATLIADPAPGWAPGTRHYRGSDGRNLMVEASDPSKGGSLLGPTEGPLLGEMFVRAYVGERAVKMVVRQTVVFLCNDEGLPVDADENDFDPLTPLRRFPAGLSHEDALAAMGYTV